MFWLLICVINWPVVLKEYLCKTKLSHLGSSEGL